MTESEKREIMRSAHNTAEYKAAVEAAAQAHFDASMAALMADAGLDANAWTHAANQATIDRARKLADTAAKSLTDQLLQSELNKIGDTIARGLESGKRPRDLYNQLQEVKSLDSNRAKTYENIKRTLEESDLTDAQLEKQLEREYQKLLQARRKTIADTEGHYATADGRYTQAKKRGASFKTWVTDQGGRVCPICSGNEAQGLIPIDEAFQDGSTLVPAHPNCKCVINYVMDTPRSIKAEKIQNERRIARTEKAKADAAKQKGSTNGKEKG